MSDIKGEALWHPSERVLYDFGCCKSSKTVWALNAVNLRLKSNEVNDCCDVHENSTASTRVTVVERRTMGVQGGVLRKGGRIQDMVVAVCPQETPLPIPSLKQHAEGTSENLVTTDICFFFPVSPPKHILCQNEAKSKINFVSPRSLSLPL